MASSRRTTAQAAGLLLAGAVAGSVLAVTIGAAASSPSAGTSSGPASYAATGEGPGGHPGPHGGPGRFGPMHGGPMQAGTVRSVGTKSVTINSAAGTKTYAVDADSDIDKNGEAKLSDLKSGDAVHFAVRPGTSTIAVLHAGDEAKDRPAFGGPRGRGGPGGPPCPGTAGGKHPAPPAASPAPTTKS